ncbi:hypothetical protein Slin15195_G080810 [Septoria linicola]|uniref:Uncharacterized protein n=1 Tax=Septoria linicola TaxID=215465 RepID=A0A9Q9AZK3_9PEZI|nr:hypothetical protein Slin15195_G080810 [Septoria linicola]
MHERYTAASAVQSYHAAIRDAVDLFVSIRSSSDFEPVRNCLCSGLATCEPGGSFREEKLVEGIRMILDAHIICFRAGYVEIGDESKILLYDTGE